MPSETGYIYFDACVFLEYLNNTPGRADVIADLLAQLERGKDKVLTSVLSRVEVAYIDEESRRGQLDPKVEARIEGLWSDSSVMEIVEVNTEITLLARQMLRAALQRGWKLKPLDAIHLATAKWSGACEFHTYDASLLKYDAVIGCKICEPYVAQSRLPNL
jgi:predicted nucleic acid-binding protein